MNRLLLLNKPFQVLSQFTDRDRPDNPRATLADYLTAPEFRAAGRLDYDSEGLLILTDDGVLQDQLANPKHKEWKTYWVQVEGKATIKACRALEQGVYSKMGRPCRHAADFCKYRLFGIEIHPFVTVHRFPTAGLNSPFVKGGTVKYDA